MKKKKRALYDGLIESLAQAEKIAAGEHVPGMRITEYIIHPAPKYSASRVKKIRMAAGFTQEMFARFCDVSLSTVRNWEQGMTSPPGPVSRILQGLEKNPDLFLRTFEEIDVLSLSVANG